MSDLVILTGKQIVLILSHATTIKLKYNTVVHLGAMQQTCVVFALDRELLRSGDRAFVGLEFMGRPQVVMPGDQIIMREGHPKGLGIVKSVGQDCHKDLPVSLYTSGKQNSD